MEVARHNMLSNASCVVGGIVFGKRGFSISNQFYRIY